MSAIESTDVSGIPMFVPQWIVGDRLRKAREEAGIGVHEMATRLGRERNSITRYERSNRVDALVLRAYAQETHVSPYWLATGLDPTTAQYPDGEWLHGDTWIFNDGPDQLVLEFAA